MSLRLHGGNGHSPCHKGFHLASSIREFEPGLVSVDGSFYRKRITFNRPLATGYATVRDQGFSVSGGRVTGARRVDRRSVGGS